MGSQLPFRIDKLSCSQLGGEAHEIQRFTTHGFDGNGGSYADHHDLPDALSCYFFYERGW